MTGRNLARRRKWLLATAAGLGAVATSSAVAAHWFGDWGGKFFGPWGTPVSAEQGSDPDVNTASNDGCPILSPDGLSLFLASNRPGGLGGQDIWVAHRRTVRSPWGKPVNLGAPVNSAADDFCPDPVIGKGLFFVTSGTSPTATSISRGRTGAANGKRRPILGPISTVRHRNGARPIISTIGGGRCSISAARAPAARAARTFTTASISDRRSSRPARSTRLTTIPGRTFGMTGWKSCSIRRGRRPWAGPTSGPRSVRRRTSPGRPRRISPRSAAMRLTRALLCPGAAR